MVNVLRFALSPATPLRTATGGALRSTRSYRCSRTLLFSCSQTRMSPRRNPTRREIAGGASREPSSAATVCLGLRGIHFLGCVTSRRKRQREDSFSVIPTQEFVSVRIGWEFTPATGLYVWEPGLRFVWRGGEFVAAEESVGSYETRRYVRRRRAEIVANFAPAKRESIVEQLTVLTAYTDSVTPRLWPELLDGLRRDAGSRCPDGLHKDVVELDSALGVFAAVQLATGAEPISMGGSTRTDRLERFGNCVSGALEDSGMLRCFRPAASLPWREGVRHRSL